MNLTNRSAQTSLNTIIFLVCYAILIGYSIGPQAALDTFWHLKTGEDLLLNGMSPWVDHYSFTFYENKISTTPILFQIIIAQLVSTFGEINGLIIFKLSYVTLLLIALHGFFRQIKTPWFIVFLILPILTYFIEMRLIVRPEAISNILIIVCLSLYVRARNNFSAKTLLPISLLLLLWVNYHSPILGYIIIFGLFTDRAAHKLIHSDDSFTWSQWLLWAAITFTIGFINPAFDHVVFTTLSISNEWYRYLSEYAPSYIAYSTDKLAQLLLITSIFVILSATKQKQYGLAVIALIVSYYSWNILRLLPAASLIIFCTLAIILSNVNLVRSYQNIRPVLKGLLIATYLCVFTFSITQISNNTFERLMALGNYSKHESDMRKRMDNRYPSQVTDYLNDYQHGGNIVNTFNIGGYLIYKLNDKYKIFIDGRTHILYPPEHYRHYLDLLNDVNVLDKDSEKYNIEYAIFENTAKAHQYFGKTDVFTLNFADENYALFSRNKAPAFPISSGLFLFPMCWNDSLIAQTLDEISLAERIFSNKEYSIKLTLQLLKEYTSGINKQQFLNSLQPENLKNDITRRLAAYLSVNSGNYKKSAILFKSILAKNQDDYLILSYVLTRIQDYATAETALILYLNSKGDLSKNIISDFDKALIIKTFTSISSNVNTPAAANIDINQIKVELKMSDKLFSEAKSDSLSYDKVCSKVFE